MELWELLAKSATKGASRGQRAPKAPERDAKLTFDKRALNQRADEINAFDNSAAGAVMSNVSSFFRPAGVAARRLIGEDNVRDLAKSWKQQSDEGRKFESDNDMRRALSWTQGLEGNMPSDNALRDLPNLNVLEGGGELLGGLGRAYRNAVYGPPAQDVLTDKAKQRLAEIKASEDAQAQRIAALRRGADQNLVERIAETVIAPIAPDTAEMFQRRQKDLSDIALEEGWTTSGAIAGSMLNLLEWINAEGKAATAAKLKNASKARKAINEVGRFMDPVQVGLDAIGDIAKPVSEELAARAWEARQAKKAKPEAAIAPQDAATRTRRYLGMDPDAAPVESAAGAADVDPLWQRLVDDYEAKMGKKKSIDWSVPGRFNVEGALQAAPPKSVKGPAEFELPRKSLYKKDGYDPEIMAWVRSLEDAKSGDEIADWYRKLVESDKQQSVADWYRGIVKSENEVGDWYRNLVKSENEVGDWYRKVVSDSLPEEDLANSFRVRSMAGDTSQPFEQWFDDTMSNSSELRKLASDTSKPFEQWFDETVNVNDISAQKRAIIDELMGSQDIATPRVEASIDNALPEASLGTEASQSARGIAPRLDGGAAESLEVQSGRPIDVGAEALPEPGVAAVDMVDNVAAPRMDEGVVPQSAVPDRIAAAREHLAKQRRGEIPVEQIDEDIEPVKPSFAMERPASKPITQRVESDANVAREVLGNDELRAALREESGISGELAAINKVNEPATPTVDPTVARMQRRLEELRAMPSRKPRDHQEMIRLQDQLQAMNAMPEPGPLGKGRVPRTPNPDTGDGFVTLNANLPSYQQVAKLASNVKRFIDDTKAVMKRFFEGFTDGEWLRKGTGTVHGAYVEFRRWFNEAQGKVDYHNYKALTELSEKADIMTRTLGDAFDAFQRGDMRFILGRDAQNYKLSVDQKTQIRNFATGKISEAEALKLLPADLVEVGKVFREWMTDKSTRLMAEQYKLDVAFVAASSDAQLEAIRVLTESAGRPLIENGVVKKKVRSRKNVDKALAERAAAGEAGFDIEWVNKARKMVDDGYRQLYDAGLWLPGDDAPADALLHWVPFIQNRNTYDPRLWHFFEDGIPSKNIRSYISHLERARGEAFPDDLKEYIIDRFEAPGSRGAASPSEMQRVMRRKDIPVELKRLYQEVNDPSYTFSVGIAQVNNMIERLKARRVASENDKYVSRPGESRIDFKKRMGYADDEVSTIIAPPGKEKLYGALANRHVHRDYHDALHSLHYLDGTGLPKDHVHNIHTRMLSMWKAARTVFESAGQFRQAAQNMYAIAEVGGFRALAGASDASKQYFDASPLYIEARSQGIFAGRRISEFAEFVDDNTWKGNRFGPAASFVAGVIDDARAKLPGVGGLNDKVCDLLEGILSIAHKVRWHTPRKLSAMWQFTDDLARFTLYKSLREKGVSPKDAAVQVKDVIYSGLRKTRFERLASMSSVSRLSANPTAIHYAADALPLLLGAGMPFFGAERHTATQALKGLTGMKPGTWSPMSDPARFFRWWGLVGTAAAWHGVSKYIDGISTEEEIDQRPDYARDVLPTGFIRIPQNMPIISTLLGANGKATYIDTRWVTPVGKYASGAFDAATGRMITGNKANPRALRPRAFGIDMSFPPGLAPFIELAGNADGFTGNKIYNELDSELTKARKSFAHVWRSWLPSWAPNPVGGAYDAWMAEGEGLNKATMKDRIKAFLQGVANDSGHSASKLASAIYNEYDYWFDKHGVNIGKADIVTDYRGRPWRLVNVLAAAMGIRIDQRDIDASRKSREKAQKAAVAEIERHYEDLKGKTKNEARRSELIMEEREAKQAVMQGKPQPRWYDDLTDPEVLWENVFNTIRNARNIKFATPSNTGPLT